MGKKHNAKTIKQLEINNQITENQQEIADKFNDYFINIGPTLAKKIPASKKLLSEYHIRSYSDSMFLFPTTDMEIINIIHDLKNSSSSDYNGIPVKVIKQCSTELSHILTYINNYNKKQDCLSRVVMVTDEKPQILNCNIQFYFK